jgi:hypothetical protein
VSGSHPFNRLGIVGLGVSSSSNRGTVVKSPFLEADRRGQCLEVER